MPMIRIGLVGNFDPTVKAHRAIPTALQLAADSLGCQFESTWIGTDTIDNATDQLADFNAIWCVPASPYKSMEGALMAIRFARETGRPFLGSCGGSQHALLEYARNVIGIANADHAESNPDAEMPLLTPLVCSLVEQTEKITLREGTRIREIYGTGEIHEQFRCRYGLNPDCEKLFENTPLLICGRDDAGQVTAFEVTDHPFFFGTLFQPERSAFEARIHPLIKAFVSAVIKEAASTRV